ncbi:hypothetical protein BGZ51_000487 [Haplosporangium sp. Z 767]|nr:hypothetical protein BGZ50_007438 [Haplosporangium sp. Z 11]KAF9188624.1 hypothetical protein BGZ51_000487 [Haplosporangium sp. Z 767]
MSNLQEQRHDESDHDEFLDPDEVDEEQILEDDQENMMDEDDDENGEEAQQYDAEGNPVDDEMVELHDDSVQGFFAHKEPVYDVALHPIHQNIAVSGGGDDKSYLWRLYDGEQLYEFAGHTDSVTQVAFSVDGTYVASGSMDGKVRVWKSETGEFACELEGPDEVVWIKWHPKGNIILAGATDSSVWMWAVPSGAFMNVFNGHSGPVTSGMFTPDGKRIVTVSEDTSLIVWDPKSAAAIHRITSEDARFHSDVITCLAINKDSSLAMTGSADGTAKLINLHNGQILGSFENHTDAVETVGFSDHLNLAATGSLDGRLNVWDVQTMQLRTTCEHKGPIIKLQWHKTQPLITSCSADRSVQVWDGRTGQNVKIWLGHQDAVLSFAMTDDGLTCVSGSDDGCALVFRMVDN